MLAAQQYVPALPRVHFLADQRILAAFQFLEKNMNGEYVFHVRGGQAKPYRTGFRISNSTVKSSCTCPSGLNSLRKGMLCKHRLALLRSDFSAVQTGPANIESFKEWARARGSAVIEAGKTRSASKGPSRSVGASSAPRARDIGIAACVDIETTGFSDSAELIEIAICLFKYDRESGEIIGIVEIYSSMQEALGPMPKSASRVNKISRAMVAAATVQWGVVQQMIAKADFLVAHNAAFESRFLSRVAELQIDKPWRCSYLLPKWTIRHGLASGSLEDLARLHGIAYKAHTAHGDVMATVDLLRLISPVTKKPYFFDLLIQQLLLRKKQ
jgi:DNA polymerase-3 subunit epsilon